VTPDVAERTIAILVVLVVVLSGLAVVTCIFWSRALRELSAARLRADLAEIDRDYAEGKAERAEERVKHAEVMREYSRQRAAILHALLDPSSVTIEVRPRDEKPN
jgi:hypothetical protein